MFDHRLGVEDEKRVHVGRKRLAKRRVIRGIAERILAGEGGVDQRFDVVERGGREAQHGFAVGPVPGRHGLSSSQLLERLNPPGGSGGDQLREVEGHLGFVQDKPFVGLRVGGEREVFNQPGVPLHRLQGQGDRLDGLRGIFGRGEAHVRGRHTSHRTRGVRLARAGFRLESQGFFEIRARLAADAEDSERGLLKLREQFRVKIEVRVRRGVDRELAQE